MRKIFCDLCKRPMKNDELAYSVMVSGFGRSIDSIPTQVIFSATEVCHKCEADVILVLNKLIKIELEEVNEDQLES